MGNGVTNQGIGGFACICYIYIYLGEFIIYHIIYLDSLMFFAVEMIGWKEVQTVPRPHCRPAVLS